MNNIQNTADLLFENFEEFNEKSITSRRFKHSELMSILDKIKANDFFEFSFVGKSVLGRDINLISAGTGKTKIFLWSQMHGNESTATMALLDIFNFFSDKTTLNEIKQKILDNLTLYFLPMVNPDGAELFQRENIFNIDINRDAVVLQTPEGRILMETFKKITPQFSFNLHDQSILYSAGNTGNPATISFLAPAFNYEKSLNKTRENSMKVIGAMFGVLSKYIPGCIARYSDEFEPRAFGDMFQSMGSSTILIESGGRNDDVEKQFIRKLNFTAILSSLYFIADNSYMDINLSLYESIPFNEERLYNLILRNLTFVDNGKTYNADVGIITNEINNEDSTDYYIKSEIGGIGDLSTFKGYEEQDLTGYFIKPGQTFNKTFTDINEIYETDIDAIIQKGFTNVIVEELASKNFIQVPINIYSTRNKDKINEIKPENPADFIITKNDKVCFVVINGFLIDTNKMTDKKINGIIYH